MVKDEKLALITESDLTMNLRARFHMPSTLRGEANDQDQILFYSFTANYVMEALTLKCSFLM